ncbi:MAG TPA: hypothetical protein PLG17_03805, partial [Thermodesulfobacteriota bacterium]|nr:hypothetical protein [Thermodesulfobacteriota bacterium]
AANWVDTYPAGRQQAGLDQVRLSISHDNVMSANVRIGVPPSLECTPCTSGEFLFRKGKAVRGSPSMER